MIALLAGGVPLLSIPLTLEQALVAQALERLGVGVTVPPQRGDYARAIHAVLSQPQFRSTAAAYAVQQRREDWHAQLDQLLTNCSGF